VLELCLNRNIYPLFSGGLQHGRLLPQPRGINPTPPLLEGLGNQNQIFPFPGPNTYRLVSVPLAVMYSCRFSVRRLYFPDLSFSPLLSCSLDANLNT
jgi:hypothetical protein